jgi:hypothetical protein
MKIDRSTRSFAILSALIICISTVLLAIWSIRDTIALRNVLLVLGALVALFLIKQYLKQPQKIASNSIWHYAPIILSACTLVWVGIHYLVFSQDSALQLKDLTSTWVRVLMASMIGAATGLVIKDNPQRSQYLWFGIFCSFAYLLVHYLEAYSQSGALFMPDYYFTSPFSNKINTVLMGGLFIAAICGASATALTSKYSPLYPRIIYFYWAIAVAIILFAYTTIIDTRNGLGVGLILLSAWVLYVFCVMLGRQLLSRTLNWKRGILILLPILFIFIFVQQHLNINRGWNNFFEDIAIGFQIDEVPNWQNIQKFGYPKTPSGEQVYPNNYERAAWAAAGVRTIQENPLGYGLLEHSLGKMIQKSYPEAVIRSSHSAWVDFGLAFGIPGLALVLGALISTIALAIRSHSPNKLLVVWMAFSLLLIFTIAEVSSNHTIEILFFCIALLNTMVLEKRNHPYS